MRIGCENPSARSSCLPLRFALKPTPWISSSLEKPAVTPFTIPAMIDRAVPYMALANRVSPIGATITFLSATVIVTTGAKVLWTLPLGPSTRTVVSLMSTLTLSGMGTGCFAYAAHGGCAGYQTLQMSSPPALFRRQSASFIRPLEVETMLIPRPFRTRGMSVYPK